jgi:nucleotide-binding universal stress UspA family protein
MTLTRDRAAPPPATPVSLDVRPVMLLTLNVPPGEQAIEVAIGAAADSGAELYVCDAIPLEYRNYVGHVARQYSEHLNRKHLDAVAARARARGVRVTQMAFHNPKPIRTALEIAQSERIGLLVFGCDAKQLGRWTFRRAVKRIRDEATCLVWMPE